MTENYIDWGQQEFIKCGVDPVYFIDTYVKSEHPKKGLLDLKLFPFQKEIIGHYQRNRKIVIVKARQLGVSTITAAYAFWLAYFHPSKSIYIVSTKKQVASNIIRKTKILFKHLPRWMKMMGAERTADNRTLQQFSNDSWLMAVPKTSELGRSEALSLVIIDEAALIDNLDDLWGGLERTVSTGGKIFVLSTPRGATNKFFQIYSQAEKKENDFISLKYPYNVCPWYNSETWFNQASRDLSPVEVRQELLCEFLGSGATVINEEDIQYYENMIKPPLDKEGFRRNLYLWSRPIPTSTYVLTLDVAKGDGKDYSYFHVIDLFQNIVVADFKDKLSYDLLADDVVEVAKYYNNALVIFDATGLGQAMVNEIIKYRSYENVYYAEKGTNKYIPHMLAYDKNANAGITISPKVRPVMIAAFEKTFRERRLVLHSARFIQELRTFVWENNKAQCSKGFNDDGIMAMAMFLYARDSIINIISREEKLLESCALGITVGGKAFSKLAPSGETVELTNKQTQEDFNKEALKKEYERRQSRWYINQPNMSKFGNLNWLLK